MGWPRDMTAAALVCGSCGTELPPNSKFCNECGAAVATATTPAEYKQVTVLFADVVHSMDIAAAVGAERLREIMAELVDRATEVVQRYGGTRGQVHRRRDYGGVRRAGCNGGPRSPRLSCGVGHSRRRPYDWPLRSKTAMGSTCGCVSA